MAKKIRLLDLVLLNQPQLDRERAFALVLAGSVSVDGSILRDPKLMVSKDACIEVQTRRYLSRGGFKLKKGLDAFNVDCADVVVLDAGASTGGFTDCLLQAGASRVYSVDVGYNQLHYQLRRDPRVKVMERTNIKDVEPLDPAPAFAVADLSFRSVVPVLEHIMDLTSNRRLIALLKPQFEIDPDEVDGFDGIVRDPKVIRDVIIRFFESCAALGITVVGIVESPIRGGKGNREFLVDLRGVPGDSNAVLEAFLALFQ